MKKLLTLFALVLLSCMGAWAGGTVVTTVKTDALYTLHCQSGADHSTARFLGDDGTTLQGRVSQPTHFRFVAAGDEMYYIQSALSGKYINAAGTTAGSAISFDAEPSTKWKVDVCENNDVALRPNGTNGVSLNNYSSQSNTCPYMQVGNRTSASNACSTWVLTEYDDIATGATSAAAIETGWYQIEVGEGHGYNGNHASYKGYYARGVKNGKWGMTLTQTPDTDPSSWIYITKVSEDNFQFTFNKDFSTEYTIGVTAEVASTPGNFQFKPRNNTENNYQFTIWSTKRIMGWNISNTPSLGSTSTTDDEDYNSCYFIFHKVGAPQVAEVAYTYKCEGVDDAIVYATQAIGSAFAAPVVPPFGSVTSVTDGTVAADNKTCIVNYTQTLPFVPGNVYYLGDRLIKTAGDTFGNIQYYSYGDASDNKVPSRAGSPQFAKNYMWTIERVANTFDQFYLKNLELGYVSTADGNSQQSVLGNNKTAMKLYEYTGTGHQSGNKDFGFTDVAIPENVFGDHASSHLGHWKTGSTTNEGSALRVVDVDFDVIPTAYTTPDAQHAGYVTEITYYNASKVATAKAQPTVDNVLAVFDSKVCTLDPNKYYRILDYLNRDVNAGPDADTEGNAINSNREIKTNASTTNVTSLWQFEEVSGSYYVKHVNSGLYIGKPSSGQVYLPLAKSDAGIFTVAEVNANKYLHTLRAGNYLNTNNQITQVHGWGADGDGSRWYIVEAESIPVTVGSAGYTTVNFPVAVSIPAEVKAYKVTAENETSMTLEEVTGNVPAGTALIVEKENGGDVTFAIVESGETITGNLLLGTTARRTGFGENRFYALAAEGDGVAFKQNGTVTAIPANKAYLPVTTGDSNKALYFDFGGITTSIDAVEVLPATDALYNINGQRVVAPTRGIYVKANGQKVFIK